MKKVFFIIALLVLAVQVPAQGIYEASMTTTNSIVRVWTGHEPEIIVYNEEPLGQNVFILYTIGNLSAKRISLPDGISVKDFEINGKDVWFCGEKADNSYPGGRAGVAGTFYIPDVFDSTGTINYVIFDAWFGNEGFDFFLRGLERLDLFEDGTYVVMAMTGDNYIYRDLSKTRSTVVSAYYNGTWIISALFDKDSTVVYTDIAALDNVVTAVGTRADGTGLLAKTFYKNSSFPCNPTVQYYCDSIVYNKPVGKAVITHTTNDCAAVAQFNLNTFTWLHMLDFSSGTAVPSAPTRITATPVHTYASPWNMQEIRYNKSKKVINVLEYGIVPGGYSFETLLWSFPFNTALWPQIPVQPFSLVKQASMDVAINSRPVTVGTAMASQNLDIHSFTTGSSAITNPLIVPDLCTDYDEIPYSTDTPPVQQIFIGETCIHHWRLPLLYVPVVSGINVTPICE